VANLAAGCRVVIDAARVFTEEDPIDFAPFAAELETDADAALSSRHVASGFSPAVVAVDPFVADVEAIDAAASALRVRGFIVVITWPAMSRRSDDAVQHLMSQDDITTVVTIDSGYRVGDVEQTFIDRAGSWATQLVVAVDDARDAGLAVFLHEVSQDHVHVVGDFTDRYEPTEGFPRLRAHLGLPDPIPLPEVEPWVRMRMTDMFAAEGLLLPYIPDEHENVEILSDQHFATWPEVYADDLYMFFWPEIERVLIDPTPRYAVGIGGHGMNSYAWTCLLVIDGLTIVAQVGRGVAFANARGTSARWNDLQHEIARLVQYADRVDVPEGHRLVVLWSDLRDIAEVSWRVDGVAPSDRPHDDDLDEDYRPAPSATEMFTKALGELARLPRI